MSGSIKQLQRSKQGMTLTEMIIAIAAGSIIALVVATLSLDLFASLSRGQNETAMLVEARLILSDVSEDMRTSSAILDTNTITDPHAPPEGWNTSNENLILILEEPALGQDRSFIVDPLSGGPYRNEYILYADQTQLLKRLLANPLAADNLTRTTCPAALATPSCPADPVLSDNFQSMEFVFYDQNGDLTSDPTLGRSVEIIINLAKNVFGEEIHVDNRVRMTLRNASLN